MFIVMMLKLSEFRN